MVQWGPQKKNQWLTAAFFGGPNDLDNGVVGNVSFISKIGMDVGWLFVGAPCRLCSSKLDLSGVLSADAVTEVLAPKFDATAGFQPRASSRTRARLKYSKYTECVICIGLC